MQKQNGFAPLLIVIIIALVIGVGVGGYYLYQLQSRNQNLSQVIPSNLPVAKPSVTDQMSGNSATMADWKKYVSPLYNPFWTDTQLQGVTAQNYTEKLGGGYANAQNIQKTQFSIMYPADWSQSFGTNGLSSSVVGDAFVFTRNNLNISIEKYYAPGGNLCSTDSVPDFATAPTIQSVFALLKVVKDFENTNAVPNGYVRFTLCSSQNGSDTYSSTTSIGKIQFTLPTNYSSDDLSTMEKIISTLQIVK